MLVEKNTCLSLREGSARCHSQPQELSSCLGAQKMFYLIALLERTLGSPLPPCQDEQQEL